ncbi:MAG: HDOD domain-containing protein [Phycisphaerae bacterium]
MPSRADNEHDQGTLSVQQLDLLIRNLDALSSPRTLASKLLSMASESAPGDPGTLVPMRELARLDPSATVDILAAEQDRPLDAPWLRTRLLGVRPWNQRDSADPERGLHALWKHSLAVAIAAEDIAASVGDAQLQEKAFAAGLLHDIGKFVLYQALPRSYARAIQISDADQGNIATAERSVIGADHSVAGRRYLQTRNPPQWVCEVVWLHHQPFEAIPSSVSAADLVALVGLADAVAREKRIGYSGNHTFPRTTRQMADLFGLDGDSLRRIGDELGGKVQRVQQELLNAPALEETDLLSAANARLRQENAALSSRLKAVESKARAFTLFTTFASEVGPQASVPEVLQAMLDMVATMGVIEDSAYVTYSLDNSRQPEIRVLAACGRRDRPTRFKSFSRTVKDCGTPEGEQISADQAVSYLVGTAEALSEWLDVENAIHLPLMCGKQWIGGVFFQPAAEAQPAGLEQSMLKALLSATGLALAIVQGRTQAVQVSEQLAGASQVLAETQEALAEARTLAAVGEMAAGAAHELNNPLAIVSGRAQLMKERAETEKDRKVWATIAEQAHKISDIITDLMEFASPTPPNPAKVPVRELLDEVVADFSGSNHPQAAASRVDKEVGAETPDLWADSEQIRSVVKELVENAATACGDQPHIRLEARPDPVNGSVLLAVRDNGPGMDHRTLSQAYTPFFSHHAAGRRPGLGLPRAKRYVEGNGGRIWIQTDTGQGTTVYVRLPAVSEE